jgi:hypothetical protein
MSGGLFGRLEAELTAREINPGLTMADVLGLPDDVRRLITWLIRERTVDMEDLIRFMGSDEAVVRTLLDDLVEKGYVREFERRGAHCVQVRLAPKRGSTMSDSLWQAIDEKVEG